jgi:RNA polymerase sigma factor (sigma-70 family)
MSHVMSELEFVGLVKAFLARHDRPGTPEEVCACEEFARVCTPIIRAKMWRVHDSRCETEDLVQHCWTVVLRKLREFEFDPSRGPITAWVSKIAERQAREHARRRWRPRAGSLNEVHAVTLVDPELGPEAELEWMLERESFQVLVGEFAATLLERDGRIFAMRFVQGHAVPEIARELGLSERCVPSVLHRATCKLPAFLHRSIPEPRDKKNQKFCR